MAVWKPTKYLKWIILLTIIPCLIVGAGIIYFSQDIPSGAEGSLISSRKQELFLLGIIFLTFPLLSLLWTMYSIQRGAHRAHWLIENGIQGTAKILDYEETGMTMNDSPKIAFKLEITTPSTSPYVLDYEEFVSLLYLSKLSIGKTLPVFVHPEKKDYIQILFEELKKA